MTLLRATAVVLVLAAVGCGTPPADEPAAPAPAEPVAEVEVPEAAPTVGFARLAGREGSGISGVVTFSQEGEGVHISAEVAGAPPGPHGFHIHEVGDCSAEDFTSAGGHFNPTGVDHGGPDADPHHGGDLGNIEIGEDGSGTLHLASSDISVDAGPTGVLGRGVILHADADDLTSQPTGAAGARLACGVVVAGEPEQETEETADEPTEGAGGEG